MKKSPRKFSYSANSACIVKIVVGIEVEVIIVATKPARFQVAISPLCALPLQAIAVEAVFHDFPFEKAVAKWHVANATPM